jgi:RimJ/RimL family protein N-acetyltransferase
MISVEKVTKSNRKNIIEYLKSDIIRHVFAFYDIQHELKYTTMHVARENNKILGYVLIYIKSDVPSIILDSEASATRNLVDLSLEDHFVMHASPNHREIILEKFPKAKIYVENWMLVKKNEAKTFRSQAVRRLETDEDAAKLAKLLLGRKDRPRRTMKRYVEWAKHMPLYGVFENNELISYAGSFIQLPQLWMIGGVYTFPEERNKGYALLATSRITQEALKQAEAAALFVRSDNYPAMRVYEKIGYRKIGEKIWVDVGTGLMP